MRQIVANGQRRDGAPGCEHVPIEPLGLGIALALQDCGFDSEGIRSVLGYLPDLEVTVEDLDAYEAALDNPAP